MKINIECSVNELLELLKNLKVNTGQAATNNVVYDGGLHWVAPPCNEGTKVVASGFKEVK